MGRAIELHEQTHAAQVQIGYIFTDARPGGRPAKSIIINDQMEPIHDRMPVIIDEGDWPLWLGEVEGDPAQLLPPRDDLALKIWPVNRRVNAPARY